MYKKKKIGIQTFFNQYHVQKESQDLGTNIVEEPEPMRQLEIFPIIVLDNN